MTLQIVKLRVYTMSILILVAMISQKIRAGCNFSFAMISDHVNLLCLARVMGEI